MGDQEAWLYLTASRWEDWVKLCLLTRLLKANCRCNYGRSSQVNQDTFGVPVPARVAQIAAEIHTACGLSVSAFQATSEKVDRIVTNIFDRRQHDRIFNGKWYIGFFAEVALKAAAGRPYNANGLESTHVVGIANAVADLSAPWAKDFRAPIEKIASWF